VSGSGISSMSDSLMPFQPAIEEPSNILPSSNSESSTMLTGKVTCCCMPRMSTNRRSTNSTLLSLISFSTFSTDIAVQPRVDGYPFRSRVRANHHTRHKPLILLNFRSGKGNEAPNRCIILVRAMHLFGDVPVQHLLAYAGAALPTDDAATCPNCSPPCCWASSKD